MNTDARVMSWFFDEYSKFEGFSPGVVTGKVMAYGASMAIPLPNLSSPIVSTVVCLHFVYLPNSVDHTAARTSSR